MSTPIPKVYVVPATQIGAIISTGSSYATAREGTGTKTVRTGTADYPCGQAAWNGAYYVDQIYLQFDNTQLVDAMDDTGTILSINLEIESVSAVFPQGIGSSALNEFDVALAPSPQLFPVTQATFIPGSLLPEFVAGSYTVVRAQDYDTNGGVRFRLTMGLDEVAVRNGIANGGYFVLFMVRQRENLLTTSIAVDQQWAEGIALPGTMDWTNPNNLRILVNYSPTSIQEEGCVSPYSTTYDQLNTMALTWTILPGAGVNPNGCAMALYTTTPTRAAEGTRPTDAAYADQDIPATAPVNNVVTTAAPITFPTATADWEPVTHWGLVGRAAGELLMFGPVEGAPLTVLDGEVGFSETGNFAVRFNGATGETNNKVARVIFNRQSPATLWADYGSSPRTMYLALLTRSGAEISGGSYARQTDTFSQVGDYAVNDSLVTFPTATSDWATVYSVGIFDPTGTELRFVVPLDTPCGILNGYTLTIPIGALKVGWI